MLILPPAARGILPVLRATEAGCSRPIGVGRGPAILALLASLLAGCARDAEPTTFAVPAAAAARIRLVCPPGTFVGTMTGNCPQPLPRAAPGQ